jgi:hypothetical protein
MGFGSSKEVTVRNNASGEDQALCKADLQKAIQTTQSLQANQISFDANWRGEVAQAMRRIKELQESANSAKGQYDADIAEFSKTIGTLQDSVAKNGKHLGQCKRILQDALELTGWLLAFMLWKGRKPFRITAGPVGAWCVNDQAIVTCNENEGAYFQLWSDPRVSGHNQGFILLY